MLDVTSDDIKSLSAKDIEDLIGLLCDAELAAHNISNAGVTRGGKIDEADEGIDIKVSVESLPRGDGYIPRCLTAYQVKKPDMPERKIRTEMCPSGRLRPAIKRIAETGGAYIIVSSGRSLSEPLLNKRLVAMREALGNTKCFVDFYGSTRIATWVNNFPGLVYWVKEKLGRPLSGWQGHGNWTSSRSDSANDYVLDKGIVLRRLYGNNEVTFQKENSTLRGEEALAYVRSILKKEKSSIRIVGLSGVGKTRFVQALFEDEIGADALPSHLVLYTDWGNRNPAPDPFDILCQLEYRRDRAILVLDNCSTKSHSEITRQLMNSSSQVSLITIEHDVREDFPVDTNAFALEPSSDDIIEKVLSNRFSKLSFSSIRRLASLSGGNFRIAIALAQYVSKNEDISELTDANLFDRIFWQNNQPNEELLSAAEVLSLVYSFDFSDYSDGSEISQFGVLAELSGRRIHKHVAELERRGLVQARGTWRAVLPHALANRLAKKCLENIPLKEIRLLLEQPKNIRLLKSSSRRMSYLKPYPKALELTAEWLEKDGIIWNRSNYDITQLEILKNLTVLHPSKVLDYFKLTIGEWGRATRSQFGLYDKIRKILTYIAYEPAYFVDSVDLLVHMYLSETTSIDATNFQQSIIAFFQVILSGTNAPVQERIRCMRNIWAIESPEAKKLAIDCLSAALKTQHFNGHPIFHFQYARKDYGFRPKDWNETRSWYHAFLNMVIELSNEGEEYKNSFLKLFADHFRGMWRLVGLQEMLENYVLEILKEGLWLSGWIAIGNTLKYDRGKMTPKMVSRLERLFEEAKPKKISDLIDVYILMKGGRVYEPNNGVEKSGEESWKNFQTLVRNLGKKVSNDQTYLQELIPQLLICSVNKALSPFGYTVGFNSNDKTGLYNLILDKAAQEKNNIRSISFIQGFIEGVYDSDAGLGNSILDEMIMHPILAQYYPWVQEIIGLQSPGLERLLRSLENLNIPPNAYAPLGYSKQDIPCKALNKMLKELYNRLDGQMVCLEIISLRIKKEQDISKELLETILLISSKFKFRDSSAKRLEPNLEIEKIILTWFSSAAAKESSALLAENLKESLLRSWSISDDHKSVIKALSIVQPEIVLDTLVDMDDGEAVDHIRRIGGVTEVGRIITQYFKISVLLEWCQKDTERAEKLAMFVTPLLEKNLGLNASKWSELVKGLIKLGKKKKVLGKLELSFQLTSWSGSRLISLKMLDSLLTEFAANSSEDLKVWANSVRKHTLRPQIEYAKKYELGLGKAYSPQSFE